MNVPSSESKDSRDPLVPEVRLSKIRKFPHPALIRYDNKFMPIKPQPPVINQRLGVRGEELEADIGFIFSETLSSPIIPYPLQ